MEPIILTNGEVLTFAKALISRNKLTKLDRIYGVPRGGIPVAYAVAGGCGGSVVDTANDATIIVDDLVDSGATRARYEGKRFDSLIVKNADSPWYVFPWEATQEQSAEDIPLRFLQYIGEDVNRNGLKDTPLRVVRSWKKLYGGYKIDPKSLIRTFDKEHCDEMVLLKDCEFYSTCEHHILPFFGKAHIAYIPTSAGKVIGISKLARILECFSRRLQIQERLSAQIADTLEEALNPQGVAVCLEAQHFCMTSRGIEKQNSIMVTSALRGVFRDKIDARAEFYSLIRGVK
jgi:GTP cyclohydrolase I